MPQLEPEMNNGGRWYGFATETGCKNALRDKSAEVIEVPSIGMTYVVSYAHLIIVRSKSFGADTFEVEGGWVYANDLMMRLDVRELRMLAANTRRPVS